MIPFRTANGADFRCQVDPDWTTYANVNFHAADRAQIAFHLSLRLVEGLAVCNQKTTSGWGLEERIPLTFPSHRFALALSFDSDAVTVRIDGVVLGSFARLPRFDRSARFWVRRGYPGLRQITHCGAEGAVPWETVETRDRTFDRLWDRVRPGAGPVLTDRMELTERLARGQTDPRHAVILPGSPDAIALRPATQMLSSVPNTFSLPEGIAAVMVPGRIWLGIAPDGFAELKLVDFATRAACPPVRIDRTDLAARLLRQTRNGSIANDDIAALQAVEHTCHAGIWPSLDPTVQAALLAAAARLGLSAFLSTAIGPLPVAVPPPVTASAPPFSGITADLSRLVAEGADRAILMDWLANALPTCAGPEAEHLALTLCPVFCEHDAFDLLHTAFASRSLPQVRATDDVGYVSLRLPFQFLDGDYDQVIQRLNLLTGRHGGWLATAAIGWIARAVAPPGAWPIPEAKRNAIIAAFCGLLTAQAKDAWGRAPCHGLMDGLLALLGQLARLPPDLRTTLGQTALAAYGLSPRFWSRLPSVADATILSAFAPDLLTAHAAFATLTDDAQSTQALHVLHSLKAEGVASAALCLHPASDLRHSAPWHSDVLLRDLFQPGATGDPDFDVRGAIARSTVRTDRTHRPPAFEALERSLGENAFTLITSWPGMSHAQRLTRLQAALADAIALSGPAAHHVGLAVSLALIRALRDDPDAVRLGLDALRRMAAMAQITPGALASPAASPGLQSAQADPQLGPLVQRALGLTTRPTGLAATPPDAATALFGTVVVVMSCHANLDSRIAAMRRGWLADLSRLGIAWIVVVGGVAPVPTDVVCLDAPDDYEGLPQKSLAAIAHVHRHFPACRMLKVDDDCFMDVEEFFFSLTPLKADYYGRPLARGRGQMDRSWHMTKSTSLRGRHDLDKSPEPSTYADGGSGYLLSPRAITALLTSAASAEGQRLTQASFMEDKLVGDLLALSGIRVAGEDYRVHVLRRARPGGLLVPKWENTCLPFQGSGIKLAHLDGHDLQDMAASTARSRRPPGAKIWPTLVPARLGAQSHALDLISPSSRFDQARKAPVAVVACVRNEMTMLPHFLAHYRNLGVDSFLIADNGSDDGTLEHLVDQHDVALFTVDSDYSQSHYGVLWQQALLAQRSGLWSVVADADELLTWTAEATGSLPDLLAGEDFNARDAARIFMLDMYPQGPLSETDFGKAPPFVAAPFVDREPFLTSSLGRGPFSDASTHTSATRHRLLPGSRAELFVAQKIALLRYQPWMRLSDGLHYVAETRLSPRALLFGHFKYNAAFRAKAVSEVARGQHFNNAEEYRKYLALINEGREAIFDPAVSVHWTDSPFVQSVLTTGKTPAAQPR